MKYDKLVRDKIPEIIIKKGNTPFTHIAGDAEYKEKLREKLQEEVLEALDDNAHVIEEFADILEVLYALCDLNNIPRSELEKVRQEKWNER